MKLHEKDNFSRRNFLKTSILAGGGMLIGFNLLTACKLDAKMPIDIASLNFNDFNAFIKISDKGYVTIFSPNSKQGIKVDSDLVYWSAPPKIGICPSHVKAYIERELKVK